MTCTLKVFSFYLNYVEELGQLSLSLSELSEYARPGNTLDFVSPKKKRKKYIYQRIFLRLGLYYKHIL